MPVRFSGRQTQFYIDLVYGVAFSLGFGYLLFVGMDPRVAAFQGGLVFGYFLRVWENMSVYEQILEEEVAQEAEQAVAQEVADTVPGAAQEQVSQELEEQVPEEVTSTVEEQVPEEVTSEVEAQVERAVEEQLEDGVGEQIEDEVDERIDDEVERKLDERVKTEAMRSKSVDGDEERDGDDGTVAGG